MVVEVMTWGASLLEPSPESKLDLGFKLAGALRFKLAGVQACPGQHAEHELAGDKKGTGRLLADWI